jgi:hypothetical protein
MEVLIEKDQNEKINGVNLVLTFAEGKKATGGKKAQPAVSELWISREVKLEQDGKYSLPATLVTRACNLDTRRNLGAAGNAVSYRFGKQGDGDDTYFAAEVPSNQALDKLMEDAIKAVNASPEMLKEFEAKGWIKYITRGENTTHIVEFPASRIGYKPMLFCPIGKDGKPVVDAFQDNWASTRNRGTGYVFNWVESEAGIVAQPVADRVTPSKQATRSYRGYTHKQGSRVTAVAKSINDQIKAHKAFVQVSSIVAQPFQERQASRKTGERPRFVSMGPSAMQAPVTPQGAPVSGIVDPASIEF